ncbi:hypothetical protein BE18_17915 [Sorangium cellulosum]|uniref:Uncharacterized protein n=1 Tax=Sorangium cellulosum TaxID=56 RepID=A0A150RN36_SORCE|nr:hypothetical protein BE18_17915 [Sorangium cellulosum]
MSRAARRGTRSRSRSRPLPLRPAISTDDEVSPAAPMSWTPTSRSSAKISRHASSRSFSMKGSPTWTVGRWLGPPSENSSEAMVAPWMPSRPVLAPT